MPEVTLIEHSGTSHTVEVEQGTVLMRAAMDNDIPGIDADCGGECACATCHVLVNEEWLGKLEPIGEQEESMLGLTTDRQSNSRLSCQITITDDLNGLVAQMPEFQF